MNVRSTAKLNGNMHWNTIANKTTSWTRKYFIFLAVKTNKGFMVSKGIIKEIVKKRKFKQKSTGSPRYPHKHMLVMFYLYHYNYIQ